MEALKLKAIAHEGKLTVEVPEEFDEKELEVIVLYANTQAFKTHDDEPVKKFHEMPVEERLKVLEQYKGTAKFPDFPISKYDVYDQ